jgi:hypothetical protein
MIGTTYLKLILQLIWSKITSTLSSCVLSCNSCWFNTRMLNRDNTFFFDVSSSNTSSTVPELRGQGSKPFPNHAAPFLLCPKQSPQSHCYSSPTYPFQMKMCYTIPSANHPMEPCSEHRGNVIKRCDVVFRFASIHTHMTIHQVIIRHTVDCLDVALDQFG